MRLFLDTKTRLFYLFKILVTMTTISTPKNPQNDRVYAPATSKKRNNHSVANLLPNSTVKKFENRLIFARVTDRNTEVPFLTHSVCVQLFSKHSFSAVSVPIFAKLRYTRYSFVGNIENDHFTFS